MTDAPDFQSQNIVIFARGRSVAQAATGESYPVIVASDLDGNLTVVAGGIDPANGFFAFSALDWSISAWDLDALTVNSLATAALGFSFDTINNDVVRGTGGLLSVASVDPAGVTQPLFAPDMRGFGFGFNVDTGFWEPSNTPAVHSITDGSGTIAVAATSQQALAANTGRRFLQIQNPSTETEPLYYDFGVAATIATTSFELTPGQAALYDFAVPATAINVIATTMGHRFFVKEGP